MDFSEFREAVCAQARQMGICEYELYYQSAESVSVSAFQQEINQFSAASEGGVCFRCIVNGKMGYASTEALSAEQAAAIVRRAADNAAVLESEEEVLLGAGGQTYHALQITPYGLPDTDTLIAGVLDAQKKLYEAHPAVVDGCTAQGISERSRIAIYNSKGLDLEYENSVSGLILCAVVTDGKEKANDYQIKLGPLDTVDAAELADKAARTALRKLGGEPAPTGTYPVVFSPEAMASLLRVFSPVFSAQTAQKGLSRLAEQEGSRIASPAVTLVDDPFHPQNPMPIHFDAEGSPTYQKNVIEQGVLKTLLYNLKTANVAGKQTTGNASKAGYDSAVDIRPFTLYLAPGTQTEAALLRQAENGVYITALNGLHAGANAVSGDFSLQSEGFLIEKGEKTAPVRAFTVAGNFYDLLQNITAVADNLDLPGATGMTAFGAPSVLVRGLSIAGK